MKSLSRIVWSEGMYLGPHHFQAQSRYFEDTIHFAAESLWFCPWGFLGVELNREALRNGTLLLTHARGVFPDGLSFDMPAADALPEPLGVDDRFSPTAHSAMVFLAVPQLQTVAGNTALDAASVNGSTRYIAEEKLIFDEITGLD